MKQNTFYKAIHGLKKINMTADEKSAVFHRAWSTIESIEATHNLSLNKGRVAELPGLAGAQNQSVKSTFVSVWSHYFSQKKFVPALSLAILLMATGGVSLAAEDSLPGQLLYPVKISVNEAVRGFTALTPEAKARFALEITDRRLKEVALLSSKGMLNAETSAVIQGQLVKQAGQIKNQVASLVSTKNIRAAQEISVNFESSLRAHELILEKISTKQDQDEADNEDIVNSDSTGLANASSSASSTATIMALRANMSDTKAHINSIIATLKLQLATTTETRANLQEEEVKTENLDKETILARLAELKLRALEIKKIASTTPIASVLRASTSFGYIFQSDLLITSANTKIGTAEYAAALTDLQKATQYLTDAEILMTADDLTKDPALREVINEALSTTSFTSVLPTILATSTATTTIGTETGTTTAATSSAASVQ